MAKSVIVKKEDKVTKVFQELGLDCTFEDFFQKFKEKYPDDWKRVQIRYCRQEEKNTKIGSAHPMPKPTQYMKNTYKTWQKKLSSNIE